MLLHCANAFEIHTWLELSLVVLRMARPHNYACTVHTQKAPFVAVTKRKMLKYVYYCYTMAATTSERAFGVIQAHSRSSRQHHSEMYKSNKS